MGQFSDLCRERRRDADRPLGERDRQAAEVALRAELLAARGSVRVAAHRLGYTREWVHQLITKWGLREELAKMRRRARCGIDQSWIST
jgi:hypothetical protein